ncbi:MAG: SurA N-terminal domain-containing protein, partial [Desulfoplanes sp.]|nr:SurA N-terminal domain-containing protein [Desulfoplanes sp.]
MMGKKTYLLGIMLALLLAVSGCGQGESQPGVVARINGEPIYLSELKSGYDLHYMDWSSSNDFDVESLRSEYGAVLGNMILQILIQQTLIQEGLAVTNEINAVVCIGVGNCYVFAVNVFACSSVAPMDRNRLSRSKG